MRACVPLFVMISGYLLLPIKEAPEVFYKKRFTRLLFPFLIWSVMYCIVPYFKGTRFTGTAGVAILQYPHKF
jgi:surface polysaccharide O-acyltransferase-like enzyme